MAKYLAMRIAEGALDYKTVVTKRPDLQAAIDAELIRTGHGDMIVK